MINALHSIKKKTADLIPYARNSRTHSEEQVNQIASSIKEFGFTNPVIVDEDNGIIAGHGRCLAAQKLGIDEVPCIQAAEKTGRKCYGMELDPKYCDVIIKRWEEFTGKKATMAGDTYEDIKVARLG